ncbi:MAG: PHB depolymerase family esterase [Planctomycetota bacterium]
MFDHHPACRWTPAVFLFLVLPCLFQSTSVGEAGQIDETLRHDGVERTFRLVTPSNYESLKQLPLVIALHGKGGSGAGFDEITGGTLSAAADKRGMLLLFPNGIDGTWSDVHVGSGQDDVGYISKIIELMVKNHKANPRRVYVTGKSNGGFMSLRMAFECSEKVTAVAAVNAQLTSALDKKKPRLPISVMLVNGTEDWLVPWEGRTRRFRGGKIHSTEKTVNYFRKHNRCDVRSTSKKFADVDATDRTQVESTQHLNGMGDTEVLLIKVIGGGHTWPGGKPYGRIAGAVSQDINASEEILDFFMRHERQ